MFRTRIVVSAFALSLIAGAAQAGPDSDALKNFGLLGNWALTCKQPPGPENPYFLFAPSDYGQPILQANYGKQSWIVELHRVHAIGSDEIAVSYRLNGENVDVVYAKEGEKHRALETIVGGNRIVISQGILRSNGKETRWYEHC